MKKTLGIITSLFAISLALSSCTSDPRNVQRDPEPVTNKAFDKIIELKSGTKVDSTATLDGKTFTVKEIGPVADNVDGLPSAPNGAKRVGVTYDNAISPASAASASVDGMPQELLGVKRGSGTIVVALADDAKDAYALISFGAKGAVRIDMLSGKVTALPPVPAPASMSPSEVPYTNPSPAATQPFTENVPAVEDPNHSTGDTGQIGPKNFGPSLPATTGK